MAEDKKTLADGGSVVEVILGIDLDPSNPEPINVETRNPGEPGPESPSDGQDWQGLLMALLEAEGITDGPVSYEEAEDLIRNRKPRQPEDDPFYKAQMLDEGAPEPERNSEGFMAAAEKALRPEEDEDKKEKE